jgi:hypothetical protein
MTQDENLPGTDSTRIKFLGVKYETLAQDFKIDDVHEFVVKGIVSGVGDKKNKRDGHVGRVVDLEVTSIRPTTYEEPAAPEDPNQPKLVD